MQPRWAVLLCGLWISGLSLVYAPDARSAEPPTSGSATRRIDPPASRPIGRLPRKPAVAKAAYQSAEVEPAPAPEPVPVPEMVEYPQLPEISDTANYPVPPAVVEDNGSDHPALQPETYIPPAASLPAPEFSNSYDPFVADCLPGDACVPGMEGMSRYIHPFLNGSVRAGDRVMGEGRLFVPLLEAQQSLLFTDIRVQFDNNEAVEGNFGLGYREILDDHWIVGLYAYYDHLKSQFDNTFNQATIGGELLTLDWDFRVNGYFPEMDGRFVNAAAAVANGLIVLNNFEERAYRGVDAEVGYRMFFWGVNDDFEVRLFGGGFHFSNDAPGFEDISGPKARIEFRAYDLSLFGLQSRLEAGVEATWDRVRDEQLAAFARLRIPLYVAERSHLTPLYRRLADLPVRDPDVIANRGLALQERVRNYQTGQSMGQVHSLGTDDSLLVAVEQSAEGDVFLVDGTGGSPQLPYGTTISLKPGQSLIGGRSSLVIQGETTERVGIMKFDGSTPTITSGPILTLGEQAFAEEPAPVPSPVPFLNLADDTLVQGVHFEGGSVAIAGQQVTGVLIRDVQIAGTSEAAVQLQNSGNVMLLRTTMENPGENGIHVARGAGVVLNQVTVTGSSGSAVSFEDVDSGAIVKSTFRQVGIPTATDPDGRLNAALELIRSQDIGIGDNTITQAAQAVSATEMTGVLTVHGNQFDLTNPPGTWPAGTDIPAIFVDGVGSESVISITSNEIRLNRLAGQTAVSLNLASNDPPPLPGQFQAIVQVASNEFNNLSGQGIVLNSSVSTSAVLADNEFDSPQIGIPGGLAAGDPGPFFVTSADEAMELEISGNTVHTNVGTVIHQPLQSRLSAFNSDLKMDVTGNEIPIDVLSVFRDATSSFVIVTKTGNTFPLGLAPGSHPIVGVP